MHSLYYGDELNPQLVNPWDLVISYELTKDLFRHEICHVLILDNKNYAP